VLERGQRKVQRHEQVPKTCAWRLRTRIVRRDKGGWCVKQSAADSSSSSRMTVQRDGAASAMCRHFWQTCEAVHVPDESRSGVMPGIANER